MVSISPLNPFFPAVTSSPIASVNPILSDLQRKPACGFSSLLRRAVSPVRGLALGFVCGGALIFSATADAASDRFLASDQTGDQHWNRVGGANDRFWREGDPSGRYIEAHDANATYHVKGHVLRTRDVDYATDTFEGGTLVLDGGMIQIKAGLGSTAQVRHLVSKGGDLSASNTLSGGMPQTLNISAFDQLGVTRFVAASRRGFTLNIGRLAGSGSIEFVGDDDSSTFNVSIADASAFTGVFVLRGGTLNVTTSDGAQPIPLLTAPKL